MSGLSIGEKGAVLKSEFETDLPARLREKEGNMRNDSEFVESRYGQTLNFVFYIQITKK